MLCGPISRRRRRQNENEAPVGCFQANNKKHGSPLKKHKPSTDIECRKLRNEKTLMDSQVQDSGFETTTQTLRKGISSSHTADSGLGDQMSQLSSTSSNDRSKRSAYHESGFQTMDSIRDHLDTMRTNSYYSAGSFGTDPMNQGMVANSSASAAPTESAYETVSRRNAYCNGSVTRERFLDEASDVMSSVYGSQASYISQESSQCYIPKHPLFGKGQMKVSIQYQFGLLTVHVIQASKLRPTNSAVCSSYVQMNLIPDDSKITRCRTETISGTDCPLFDEKFSFEVVPEEDSKKRLMLSLWNRGPSGWNEMIGCMSFGLRHVMSSKKEVNGWYYLLPERVGKRKHLQVARVNAKLPSKTKVKDTQEVQLGNLQTMVIKRTSEGFGFTVAGTGPVVVGRVQPDSSAYRAGLMAGDRVVRLNGQNVCSMTSEKVAMVIRNATNMIVIDIHRSGACQDSDADSTMHKVPLEVNVKVEQPLHVDCQSEYSDLTMSRQESSPDTVTSDPRSHGGDERCHDSDLDDTLVSRLAPHPSLVNQQPCSVSRRSLAIEKLLLCEEQFVTMLEFGIQTYTQPLRPVMPVKDHVTLFQNVEKLSAISQYFTTNLNKKLNKKDVDSSFIGELYKNKISMVTQAYQMYLQGLPSADNLLRSCLDCQEFLDFVDEAAGDDEEAVTIGSMLVLPVEHLKTLTMHLQFLQSCTPPEHPDATDLKVVLEAIEDILSVLDTQNWTMSETSFCTSVAKDTSFVTKETSHMDSFITCTYTSADGSETTTHYDFL